MRNSEVPLAMARIYFNQYLLSLIFVITFPEAFEKLLEGFSEDIFLLLMDSPSVPQFIEANDAFRLFNLTFNLTHGASNSNLCYYLVLTNLQVFGNLFSTKGKISAFQISLHSNASSLVVDAYNHQHPLQGTEVARPPRGWRRHHG